MATPSEATAVRNGDLTTGSGTLNLDSSAAASLPITLEAELA